MKFCFIVSIPHLKDYALKSNYHLILAHLMKNKTYYDFYKQRRENGDFVILDNSFFELGKSFDEKELIDLTLRFQPNEVVTSEGDNLENNSIAIKNFITQLRIAEESEKIKYTGKIAAVIKGNTLEEYIESYRRLHESKEIDTICIPVHMSKVIRRYMFFNILERMGLLSYKQHHLLGLEFPEELRALKKCKQIRSCDSSIPFWHGVYGVKLHKDGFLYEKISKKVDFEYWLRYKEQHKIIKYNISKIKGFIK